MTATRKVRKRRCEQERKSVGQFRLHCMPKTASDRIPIFSAGQTAKAHFSRLMIVAAEQFAENGLLIVIPNLPAAGGRSVESVFGLNPRKVGFLGTQRASE